MFVFVHVYKSMERHLGQMYEQAPPHLGQMYEQAHTSILLTTKVAHKSSRPMVSEAEKAREVHL